MAGLYARDYLILTQDEIEQRKSIDEQGRNVQGAPFGRKNMFHKYPKAIRHHTLLWTNIRTRKCTNTKKTRKKDEENTKDTRNFAYFSSKQRTESSGENSPLIYGKSVV